MELHESIELYTPFLFQISMGFARKIAIPAYFEGVALAESKKTVYIYGRGTTRTKEKGICCNCGRKLTHPVSVYLGIGPECGGHFWDWKEVGGYKPENIDIMRTKLIQTSIDSWFPKKTILMRDPLDDVQIQIPENHEIIKQTGGVHEGKGALKKEKPKHAKAVQLKDKKLKIYFDPYEIGEDGELIIEKVRGLPNRRFNKNDPNDVHWVAPLTMEAVETLWDAGFKFNKALKEWYQNKVAPEPEAEIPEHLSNQLYPFQRDGVQSLLNLHGRALLADEMGLGKTIQALAYLRIVKEARPAVIVCMASLKLNWYREAKKWLDKDDTVQIVNGMPTNGNNSFKIYGDVIIINYEILSNKPVKNEISRKYEEVPFSGWVDYLIQHRPKAVVIDESHLIKNHKTKRARSVTKLAKRSPRVVPMSGTPFTNRPREGFNTFHLVDPSRFPSFFRFADRYCDPEPGDYATDYDGASNTEELHRILTSTFMIRRRKNEVLPDLPPKIRSVIPLEINNGKEYERAVKDFLNWLEEKKGKKAADDASKAEELTRMEYLKQIAVKGKIKQAADWIANYADETGKLIVFTTHNDTVQEVRANLDKRKIQSVQITGSDTQKARDEAQDRLNNYPEVKVLVANLRAGGTGLNLTAAAATCFVEVGWTPGEQDQAEDRVHRIGQAASEIVAYYLVATDTIEETLVAAIDEKRQIIDSIMDGKEPEKAEMVLQMIKELRNK